MVIYYFFPRVSTEQLVRGDELDRERLAEAGIDERLADIRKVPLHASVSGVRDGKGPGGQSGAILTPVSKHRGTPLVGNAPDRQTWIPVGEGSKLWIGALTKNPPTPLDLERWKLIGGLSVADPKHYEWRVPVARAANAGLEFGTLPQSYTFDEAGNPVPNLLPNYAWLWDLGAAIRDWYASQVPPVADAPPEVKAAHNPRPSSWLVQTAARVLGVNYRVGLPELNLMHQLGHPVLTQETVAAICQAVVNFDLVEEAKKKPEESDSASPPN